MQAPALQVSAREATVPNEPTDEARYQAYWAAIQERVCGTCLDQSDDGTCGLRHRTCALQAHLPRVTELLSRVQSTRMDEYEVAVRSEICSSCAEQAPDGSCAVRGQAACALYAYLPLVLEAIEDVNERMQP
jgi:hypothetical protein